MVLSLEWEWAGDRQAAEFRTHCSFCIVAFNLVPIRRNNIYCMEQVAMHRLWHYLLLSFINFASHLCNSIVILQNSVGCVFVYVGGCVCVRALVCVLISTPQRLLTGPWVN